MSSTSTLPTFPKLNDSNYAIWKHNMQAHLLVKSLCGITSGDEIQPSNADPSAVITWKEKAGQAAGSIYLMLEPDM